MSESWWVHPSGVQSVLREEIKIRDTRIKELEAKLAEAVEALSELAESMDAVYEGEYTPDSFTTQFARTTLAELKGQDDD